MCSCAQRVVFLVISRSHTPSSKKFFLSLPPGLRTRRGSNVSNVKFNWTMIDFISSFLKDKWRFSRTLFQIIKFDCFCRSYVFLVMMLLANWFIVAPWPFVRGIVISGLIVVPAFSDHWYILQLRVVEWRLLLNSSAISRWLIPVISWLVAGGKRRWSRYHHQHYDDCKYNLTFAMQHLQIVYVNIKKGHINNCNYYT